MSRVVFLGLCVLLLGAAAQAGASTMRDVSGAFTFNLQGTWSGPRTQGEFHVWSATDAAHKGLCVGTICIPADPRESLYDELEPLVSFRGTALFPEAEGFAKRALQTPAGSHEVMYFRFQGGVGEARGLVAGGKCYVTVVWAPTRMAGFGALAASILGSVKAGGGTAAAPPKPAAGGGGGTAAPTAKPTRKAPAWQVSDLEGIAGVQIKDTNGSGVVGVLRAFQPSSKSASATFKGLMGKMGLNSLKVLEAQKSRDDRFARGMYAATRQGQAIKGELVVSMGTKQATIEHIYGPAATFGEAYKSARSMLAKLTRAPAAGAVTKSTEPLHRLNNRDATAWLSVPDGWQVTEGSGIAFGRGPANLAVLVGCHTQFWTRAGAQQVMQYGGQVGGLGAPIADFMGPERAVGPLLAWVGGVEKHPVSNLQVLSTQRPPQLNGTLMQHIRYSQTVNGQAMPMEALAFVSANTLPPINWFGALNLLAAPQAAFNRKLPLLMRIYQSYGISQQLLAQRWAAVMRDQDEITSIIQEVVAGRGEAVIKAAERWDKHIRDVTPVVDPATGEIRDIAGMEDIQRWANENPNLNLEKLQYAP